MSSSASFLDSTLDISGLEEILLKDGNIVPANWDDLKKFSQPQISLFCHKYAIYSVPTTELIGFLKAEVAMYPLSEVMEIGAGNGVFGRTLGIRMVDNMMQTWPDIKEYYDTFMQPTINYGKDVTNFDANKAIVNFKPKLVIANWVTQKVEDPTKEDGNVNGVDEEKMFTFGVEKYIHIGNTLTHGRKRILKSIPSTRLEPFDWLVSRSQSKEQNIIYIFENE